MFHWQLVLLFILFITTICLTWPLDDDNSKICFNFSGSNDDAKCLAYCKEKKGKGGSCNKKRCVCNDNHIDDNQITEAKGRRFSFFHKPTSHIGVRSCQLYCKNKGKLDGSRVNGICVCSK